MSLGLGLYLNIGSIATAVQPPLLDTYTGAVAGYSLRKISSTATNSLRVRRSLDNAETDIGFAVDGNLDNAALLAFVGTGGADNGYVTTWYDQSGNANNATQATAANQPQIVSAGNIITSNGYQVIRYDNSNDNLVTSLTATGTMLMGGSDGSALYEVAIAGSYGFFYDFNPSQTKHPLNESIRVIWGSSLTTEQKTAIETEVTYTNWDFSGVTNFFKYWHFRFEITEFPLIDTSSGTNFSIAFRFLNKITSFPALDLSAALGFFTAWEYCQLLTTFPANMFDSVTATNFTNAFVGTNLTQTSIDNILTSIDTAGQSGGTFNQSGGSAPSAVGEAAIDNLRARGWTVTVTGGY